MKITLNLTSGAVCNLACYFVKALWRQKHVQAPENQNYSEDQKRKAQQLLKQQPPLIVELACAFHRPHHADRVHKRAQNSKKGRATNYRSAAN